MYLVNFMRAREIHKNETRGIREICKSSFFRTRHYSSTHQANPGKTWGRTTEQPEINLTFFLKSAEFPGFERIKW